MRILYLLLPALLIGCTDCPDKTPPFTQVALFGRDEHSVEGATLRRPIYRVNIPTHWTYCTPKPDASLQQTTQPLLSCKVDRIEITVHSFPSYSLEQRIPPEAQVNRWRGQLGKEISYEKVTPICRAGFYGLLFEASSDQGLLALSMQIDPMLYQTTRFLATTQEESEYVNQITADYTIKAVGPTHLIKKHREELLAFSKSFELISALPNP